MSQLYLAGRWYSVCREADGRIAWAEPVANGVCVAALTDLLQVHFAAGTQKTQWFAGLMNNSGFTAVSPDDTISSHAGWSEYTGYQEAARPQLSTIQVAGGVLSLSSAVVFTFTAQATIAGVFVVSNSTKGGSTGTLWSTAPYSSARVVLAGQTLTWTYTLRAAGGVA